MLLLDLLNSAVGISEDAIREKQEKKAVKDLLRQEIAQIRQERQLANEAHDNHVHEHQQQLLALQRQIDTVRKNFHKRAAVHQYAAELKVKETPSYILILQAKLCREVHHMCVEDHQLKLVKRLTSSLAKFAKKRVMLLEQEWSYLEIEVLNNMAMLEMQQRELQEEYTQKVLRQRLEVADMQKTIGEDARNESGMDNLMDNLSMLNTKLKYQTEPQHDEISLEDLKAENNKKSSLEQILGGSWTNFNNSWASDGKDGGSEGKKTPPRRGSILSAGKWESEKFELKWT